VRRLVEQLRAQGAAGLVHGNRGRRPANRVADVVAERVVELARTTYAGFNPVHLAESLTADPEAPLDLSPRTVRRILAAAAVATQRTRRTSRGHPRGRAAAVSGESAEPAAGVDRPMGPPPVD